MMLVFTRSFVLVGLICVLGVGPVAAQDAGRMPQKGAVSPGGFTYIDADNPVTTSGVLRVWRAYSNGGGRVILKVWRHEGDRLVQVGSSSLETVPPGLVATFSCQIPVSRSDIIGCYCPDVNCVDRFSNGLAFTSDSDVGTSLTGALSVETGTPAIFAGTSYNIDIPSSAAKNLVLPVVGRTPGFQDTMWVTSLEIFNTSSEVALINMSYNRADADNTLPAASELLSVPPRQTVSIADLLRQTFGFDDGTGSVDLVASAPIMAHARIVNQGSVTGTYGQLVPAVPVAWAVRGDDAAGFNPQEDVLNLFEVREDERWRTNLGLVNTSAIHLRVNVTAFDGTSPLGHMAQFELLPRSQTQINRVLNYMSVPYGRHGVRLEVAAVAGNSARFLAYASRVENFTGDAIFLCATREASLPDGMGKEDPEDPVE